VGIFEKERLQQESKGLQKRPVINYTTAQTQRLQYA